MSKAVVLVGALDTKGEEFRFVRDLIQARGIETIAVDFGVLDDPPFQPDINSEEVARAGGSSIAELRSSKDKARAMQVMANGLAAVVKRLYDEGRLGGILGMAGSGGTSIATTAMRDLPVGVPKLMVSTVGGGDVSAYVGHQGHHHDALGGGCGGHQLDQSRASTPTRPGPSPAWSTQECRSRARRSP